MVRSAALSLLCLLAAGGTAAAQDRAPLLTADETEALAGEISGAGAKQTIVALSQHHRMRGSEGYEAAAALIVERLKAYGLSDVETIRLPADGRIFYGTQRSRPAWNARFAELWEQREEGGRRRDSARVASWADQPITLAQDSVSGGAEAELVDIGAGTPAELAGKELKGRLVLTSAQPEAVAKAAVTQGGAAGIVSWAQNQRSAWWGEDESLIRWGHLSTWSDPAFAFMVSPAQARAWQQRLAGGERVRLRARVEAGRSPGAYLIPTAVIPGRNRDSEIVFSCHLDHPSPGANDNASGCAGILEVARTISRLIADKRLPQPERSLRFIWPCEIECTIALLNARPEFARRTLATIHLDMIGGNSEVTKGNLKVEGSPPSLPSAVSDIAFAIAHWVDGQAGAYADTGSAAFPLLDPEGTKQPLRARIGGFSEGSDHQIWSEGSWRIPVVYLADWPDIYIHTNKDVPGNIDATKLKRAMFVAAASGWTLAGLSGPQQPPAVAGAISAAQLERSAATQRRSDAMRAGGAGEAEIENLWRHARSSDQAVIASLARLGFDVRLVPDRPSSPSGPVYRREPALKGPMNGFGYSWLDDRLDKAGTARPALLSRAPLWDGPSYGYEALNLVDGRRSVGEIRDALAATVGPVPLEEVADYLATLERLGVVRH